MNSNIAMTTADLQNHNTLYGNTTYGGLSNSHTMNSLKTDEDEMDFQDNKSEASSLSGGGKSKVFQCTGYGECNMVFTRSEHLARHMRKHTGEKPFKCVVSGCERMFSRFDNMMQHTQTHNKARGGPRRTKPKTKRGGKKASGTSRRASSSDDYDDYGPFPSPPPSRTNSSMNLIKEQHIILPNPKYVQIDEDEDEDMLISEDDQSIQQQPPPPQQQQYRNQYPTSPSSSSDSSYEYTQPIRRRRSAPRVQYQPYPTNKYTEQAEILPVLPRRNSALSQLANYLVNNPDQSPESYLTKHTTSPPNLTMTRRLSIQDLSNPIEELDGSKLKEDKDTDVTTPMHEEGVDLTEDEYQAIQGFGQFYRSAITCNK